MCADVAELADAAWIESGCSYDGTGDVADCAVGGARDGAADGAYASEEGEGSPRGPRPEE